MSAVTALSRPAAVFLVLLSSVIIVDRPAHAGIVFQSATLGPTGQTGGWIVNDVFYVGAWFSLTETTRVTAIGGHIEISGGSGVLTSIVALSPGVLPDTSFDIQTDALVSGVLRGPTNVGSSEDVRVSVDAELQPGDYAIVMGGMHSETTFKGGTLANNNGVIPGVSFFSKFSDGWNTTYDHSQVRFVVEGTAVPEPAALTMVGLAALGFAAERFRRLALSKRAER